MEVEDLPQYGDDDYLGDKGVRMVDQIISDDLKWIFRDQRKADLGIDAQIELVSPEKRGTGRLIAAQIKCGPSFLKERTEFGFVFRGKSKHLKYWIEHSLPVMVILCDPADSKCYWQEVSAANTELLAKGWKLIVPFSHVLGADSKNALTSLAGRPQHGDIVEALLYGFLHEKYTRKIEICTIFELPRDYHVYAFLAKISGEMVMIDVHHDQYGQLQIEDLKEIVRWKEYNTQQCGATKLHIYVSSESRGALSFSEDIRQYIASQPGVEVFPLLYSRSPMLWLNELDNNGREIQFWPD
ncbi:MULTISPECIES: DUF4365 domain-containing protein [Pseudomonas]|jgi:hypothetical protein|uniref:DUF4365 domain-containing protein n=1 Tax=Pseudomonas TaxID=286 RepID=UPI002160997E|nr:DUF4365 domain-containing protein [Pseudomonas sp. B21-021]UVM25625.1 DUF4365 domain-containing protein [Pseudomonas sp. B21-021]